MVTSVAGAVTGTPADESRRSLEYAVTITEPEATPVSLNVPSDAVVAWRGMIVVGVSTITSGTGVPSA